ncbi:MAG: ATP-dependent DNA helicase [Patescibacteria group bacterium]
MSIHEPNSQEFELTAEDIISGLNDAQTAAVIHDQGPQLIIAGAGTGKTMVITRRVAWLVATGKAKPEEILALTFTDKAAGEMEERIDKLMPLGYVNLWVMTFHSFCQRLLQEYGLHIGLPNEFRLLNEVDAYLLVRQNFDRFRLNHYRPIGNPTKFVQALLKHFSRAKDEVITPEQYIKFAQEAELNQDHTADADAENKVALQELADAYHVYQQLLLEQGVMDFGDLNLHVIELLQQRPNVLQELRQRFKYIVVDEFQDTNWAQYELVKLLAGDTANITVVGDDDQSIYKFRGASISNILQFKDDYPETKEVILNVNYRSLQEILDHSYRFIQHNNPNRLEAKMGEASKRLTADRPGKGEVSHLHFTTLKDEVTEVIETIIKLKNSHDDLRWNDFCVLVRSHSHADPFTAELQRRGVPFQYLALKGLYAKPIILDCICYLKLLDNYHESPALYRVLTSPPFGLPGADLIELTHTAENRQGESLYEAIKRRNEFKTLSPEGLHVLDRLLGLLNEHSQSVRKEGVSATVKRFLYDSGYIKLLIGEDTAEKKENRELVKQLLDRIKRFEEMHDDANLKRFMQELELERESGDTGALAFDPDVGPDMVHVMTVHSSKGLEFAYVFIVNLVDQRFPTTNRGGEIYLPDELTKEIIPDGDMHLEEERRLFYVAMTRAKDGLFLSSAEDYGGRRRKKPSRFLLELGFDKPEATPSLKRMEEIQVMPEVPAIRPAPGYAPPTSFSFSQLEAYYKCPAQYRFAHVLRLPIFGKPSMSFGKTMHATLELFMNELSVRESANQGKLFAAADNETNEFPISQAELLEMYDNCWIDDWYRSKKERDEYRTSGRQMLIKFYESAVAERPKAFLLEKDFSLKIAGRMFRGKIDRIDQLSDGTHEIIDYKTGNPKEKLTSDDKRQLLLYQLAASTVLNLKPAKLTFHFMKNDTKQSFIGGEKDLAKLEEGIEETLAEISAGNFAATPDKQTCRYCDFADICEHRAK